MKIEQLQVVIACISKHLKFCMWAVTNSFACYQEAGWFFKAIPMNQISGMPDGMLQLSPAAKD